MATINVSEPQAIVLRRLLTSQIQKLIRERNKTFMAYGPGADWQHWKDRVGDDAQRECQLLKDVLDELLEQ